MNIGFTGTRNGMTDKQKETISKMLSWLENMNPYRNKDHCIFHHGCCKGADYEAGVLAKEYGMKIVAHPPLNKSQMADCYRDETRPARPYLVRDHDIVDETDILIAIPKLMEEELRSGTWATIRYAKKVGKPIFIIWPDGNPERGDK